MRPCDDEAAYACFSSTGEQINRRKKEERDRWRKVYVCYTYGYIKRKPDREDAGQKKEGERERERDTAVGIEKFARGEGETRREATGYDRNRGAGNEQRDREESQ